MKRILILACVCASVGAHATLSYDNTTTFTGSGFSQGGTTSVSGVLTTNMVLDDLTMSPSVVGQTIGQIVFSTANFNTGPTTARMRVRFFANDGSGGGPGTIFGAVSFAATSIASGGLLWSSDFTSLNLVIPTSTIWAGVFFDNSGAANTTATELDNLGQLVFDPPTVGSSADQAFLTTTPSSFLSSNPAGSFFNFNGQPHANFGWQINTVPEPCSIVAIGLGLATLARRRRRN